MRRPADPASRHAGLVVDLTVHGAAIVFRVDGGANTIEVVDIIRTLM